MIGNVLDLQAEEYLYLCAKHGSCGLLRGSSGFQAIGSFASLGKTSLYSIVWKNPTKEQKLAKIEKWRAPRAKHAAHPIFWNFLVFHFHTIL